MSLVQATQFQIKKLSITSYDGSVEYDIRQVFEELNIFENILLPCMSGNIVIRDAVGLSAKINFDGSEYLNVKISKFEDEMEFDRKFIIYKQSERKEVTQNSEMYVLHFVSEEFILSQQKKIKQSFKGTYSEIIQRIMKDYLKINFVFPEIANIAPTKGLHNVVAPNKSPFDVIEMLTKQSVSQEGSPDYLFWQNNLGYNFMPISMLISYDPLTTINFGAKNVGATDEVYNLFGARDLKVISQFNMAENIQNGVYASKFIGFDPLTRTIQTTNISHNNVYGLNKNHANEKPLNTNVYNKEKKMAKDMFDSKVTLYHFELPRMENSYLKSNDSQTASVIDDTHNYKVQRKVIFQNLMQKRLRVTMPGNFLLYTGSCVQLNVPNRFIDSSEEGDKTLSGKYLITATRHIIRYDKHETIIEVSTDSTNFGS